MMEKSLLDIVVISHSQDEVAQAYVNTIARAFEYLRPDRSVAQFADAQDPWERVQVISCVTEAELDKALTRPDTPTLYVILLSEMLLATPEMVEGLEQIAGLLPREDAGSRNALVYSFSEQALQKLPPKLRRRQARETGTLGENRIRPFNLALLAMHRARLVLGTAASSPKLRLFLSHAKADGLFFAKALKESILNVPEVECFYDADDLAPGSDWAMQLENAASHSVLIALRTPVYEQRLACREEFETALLHGVPIVVVDAMSTALVSSPSHLPFSAMPTVRIADGNTHRVVSAALREHLRLLLMEAIAREKAIELDIEQIRVWPRFPCLSTMTSRLSSNQYWLIPQSQVFEAEFQASRDLLASLKSSIKLEVLETFRPTAATTPTAAVT